MGRTVVVEAAELLALPETELFASATAIREHFFSNKVEACFIINAKSGNCNMNCRFCSQSGFNSTEIEHYPFKSGEEPESIVSDWVQYPVGRCGIVTSGGALTIMRDFADGALLEDDTIDHERGIIVS